MKALLHIGIEKTGSTTIQDFLSLNASFLEEQGYYYPKGIGAQTHSDLLLLAYDVAHEEKYGSLILLNKDLKSAKKRIAEVFTKELQKQRDKTIIISSELFQSRLHSIKDIQRFKTELENLGFKTFQICVYLREQADLFCSLYSEALKWDEIDTLYIQSPSQKESLSYAKGYKKSSAHFTHIANHAQTLQHYAQVFGKDQLIIRLFETEHLYQNNLLADFIHAINLKWDDRFKIPHNKNKSLNLYGIELLRTINPSFPLFKDGQHYPRANFIKLLNQHFCIKKDDAKFHPPKEIYQSYHSYFEECNAWVLKHFFQNHPTKTLFVPKDLKNYQANYQLHPQYHPLIQSTAQILLDMLQSTPPPQTPLHFPSFLKNNLKKLFGLI